MYSFSPAEEASKEPETNRIVFSIGGGLSKDTALVESIEFYHVVEEVS